MTSLAHVGKTYSEGVLLRVSPYQSLAPKLSCARQGKPQTSWWRKLERTVDGLTLLFRQKEKKEEKEKKTNPFSISLISLISAYGAQSQLGETSVLRYGSSGVSLADFTILLNM